MICHHHKCIFIHIPKTAGQSIEHVFLDLLGLTWETRAPLLLRFNDRKELGPPRLAHLKANDYVNFKYISEELFNSYFKFSFVRNPWSRLVSFYNYRKYYLFYNFKYFVMKHLEKKYGKKNTGLSALNTSISMTITEIFLSILLENLKIFKLISIMFVII